METTLKPTYSYSKSGIFSTSPQWLVAHVQSRQSETLPLEPG